MYVLASIWKKYHSLGTVRKPNRKSQNPYLSLSRLGIGIQITVVG
jgi:hypothetical protein